MSINNFLRKFEDQLDSGVDWYSPPKHWHFENDALTLYPDPQTDYWQRTHYGFQNDNGHFLFTQAHGDFVLATGVRFYPQHQYDQAGLMVRISRDFWIKTSIEFEPEHPNRLGAVVTRHGYSDWSTQDISKDVQAYQLRIRRERNDYIVEYRQSKHESWSQIRMTHLENPTGATVKCGLYACSPVDSGFKAQFEYLTLEYPNEKS